MNKFAVFTIATVILIANVIGCASVSHVAPQSASNAVVDSVKIMTVADSVKAITDSILVVRITTKVDSIKKITDSILAGIAHANSFAGNARVKAEKARNVSTHVRVDGVLADSVNALADMTKTLADRVKVIADKIITIKVMVVADSALADSAEALFNNAVIIADSAKVTVNNAKTYADSAMVLAEKIKAASIQFKMRILDQLVKQGECEYDQGRKVISYGEANETTGIRTSIIFSQLDTLQHPDGIPDFVKDPDGNVKITAIGRKDENGGGNVTLSCFFYNPTVAEVWDVFGKIRYLRREGNVYEGKFVFLNQNGKKVEVLCNELDPYHHPFGFPSFQKGTTGNFLLVANYRDGTQAIFTITKEEVKKEMESLRKLLE